MGFLLNTDYLLFMHVYNCSQHMSLSNIYIITDNFILLTCIRFQRVCKSSKYFFKILNGFSEVMVTYWIFFFLRCEISSHCLVLNDLVCVWQLLPLKESLFTVLLLCSWPLPWPQLWGIWAVRYKSRKRLVKVVEGKKLCNALMNFLPKLQLHCCHISLNNREIFPLMDNGGRLPNESLQRQPATFL